jgi:protein-tyrosine-phosphatase
MVATAIGQSDTSNPAEIVFVCEHGAAKSVIAAAYFNKLTSEKGLRERAIYRGASPQAELSVATLKGLRDDGLTVPTSKPGPIASDDVTSATHTFAIGCSLPPHASRAARWTAETTCQRSVRATPPHEMPSSGMWSG